MASASGALTLFTFVTLAAPSIANVFLGAHPTTASESMTKEYVAQTLSSELEALSSSHTRAIEDDLRSMYAALPKNEYGNIESATVRYAVHRYFAHKHGWHVEGLAPSGDGWNASSPTKITVAQAPAYIQVLFEERVHGHGLSLQELAVFAATMADLIRNEAVADLQHIYSEKDLSTSDRMTASTVDELMDVFLVAYIHGWHADGNFEQMRDELVNDFFSWHDTSMFIQDLRVDVEWSRQSLRNPFVDGSSFSEIMELSEEFVHEYGSFANMECRSLKERLLDMEVAGTGRVTISSFYGGVVNDADWPFVENLQYLRALGALDESVPSSPSVIIPNYLTSRTNCVNPSAFYSVCCLDECESLMAHVEFDIAEPAPTAARIVNVISSLASDTVHAPRNLSTAQISRLDQIAQFHGGNVPLHGRLFAQWMHHSYPRECAFPHVSGTTNPLLPEEWRDQIGRTGVSNAEARRHTSNSFVDVESEIPWTSVEELVATHSVTAKSVKRENPLRLIMFIGALSSAGIAALRGSRVVLGGPGEGKVASHMV